MPSNSSSLQETDNVAKEKISRHLSGFDWYKSVSFFNKEFD